MTQKYTRLLVVKVSSPTHDKLKELAKEDRRTLSSLSRIIIEDYIAELDKNQVQNTGK